MSPFLLLAVFFLYAYVSSVFLPMLLALAGGCVLAYFLLGGILAGSAPAMSTRRKLMLASWSAPSEGSVFGVLRLNAEPLHAYLDQINAIAVANGRPKVSVTTAVVKALALAMRDAPSLNSRIVFDRFVPRESIDIACLVALDGGKDLANAKIVAADTKSLGDISDELRKKADKLRAHADADFEATKPLLKILPVPVIRAIVSVVGFLAGSLGLDIPALGVRPYPFGSAMVSSVGMLGVEQAFVPFTPFARVPLLLMIGDVTKQVHIEEAEQAGQEDRVVIRRSLTLTATMDHRFADGSEAARLSKRLKSILEAPHLLDAAEQIQPLSPLGPRAKKKPRKPTF